MTNEEREYRAGLDTSQGGDCLTPADYLEEAEEFRAKHGLSPAIPAEEISEVMGLAELGQLPTRCTPCYEGEHFNCWGHPCGCCGPQAKLRAELRVIRKAAEKLAL